MKRKPTANTITMIATMVIQLNCMGVTSSGREIKDLVTLFIASAVRASTTNELWQS